ncbi:MAG: undecaprenyl-phosphate galactose phosphotransferase WbaP [bacterium]|nr:undecaprenyl-phosphate galactose phosphotransferase WbaP [bacterium]
MTIFGPSTSRSRASQLDSPTHPEEHLPKVDAGEPRSDALAYVLELTKTSLPLIVVDLVSFWTPVLVIAGLFRAFGLASFAGTLEAFTPFGLSLPLFLGLLGVYPGSAMGPSVEIKRLSIGVSLLFGSFSILAVTMLPTHTTWIVFAACAWLLTIWSVAAGREVGRALLSRIDGWGVRAIVIGNGDECEDTYRTLMRNRASGLRPVAFLDSDCVASAAALPREAAALARRQHAFWAIVVDDVHGMHGMHAWRNHDQLGVANLLVLSPRLSHSPFPPGIEFYAAGLSGVRLRDRLLHPLCRFQKRVLDLAIVGLGSIVAVPLVAALAIAIKLTSRGPVFFRHKRIGRGGEVLHVWKFRTMIPDAQKTLDECLAKDPELRAEWEKDQKLKNDPRVTSIGKLLRRLSLDELPQLWNVLRGEMSLVGPRPIVDDEVAKYADSFELYKKVWPGVTGLWQISGRNNTTYEERVELDSYYARNWSIWLEMHILLRTVRVVLGGHGAF